MIARWFRLAGCLIAGVLANACDRDAGATVGASASADFTGDPVGGAASVAASEAAQGLVRRPHVDTQPIRTPCAWLNPAEVEAIVGKLSRAPQLVASLQSPRVDQQGRACRYRVAGSAGDAGLVLEVDLAGGAEIELADDMIRRMLGGSAASVPRAANGWDRATTVGDVHLWRIGHLAVLMSGDAGVRAESLDRLAAAVRDGVADLPFASPDDDPNLPGTAPDPCSLVTSAEAEAALGPLAVAAYRSASGRAIAESDGPSCTYYSQGHRALIVTPTWTQGRAEFDTAVAVARMTRAAAGGSDAADLLDGPWEEAASGSDGTLLLLEGDRMLAIDFASASTDLAGAARIGAAALERL